MATPTTPHNGSSQASSSIFLQSVDQPKTNPIKIPLPSTAAHSTPHRTPNTNNHHNNLSTIDSDLPENPPTINPRHQALLTSISTLTQKLLTTRSDLSKTLTQLQNHPTFLKQHHSQSSSSPSSPSNNPTSNTTTTTTSEQEQETQTQLLNQARKAVSNHIKLLHQYNEIKDIGMGLLGLVADREGKRLVEVMEERGVDEKD